jgi:hypothetical protein
MKNAERAPRPLHPLRGVLLLAAAGALVSGPLAAQAAAPASPPPVHDPLGLGWLVGEWEGEGWIRFGPDGQQDFRQHESVRPALGGRGLVIEGTAFAVADGRVLDELGPVHQALAVVTRDPVTGEVAFRAYRIEGERVLSVDADAETRDGRLVWSFRDPAFGEMRYTVVRTPEGEWHETGRISPDGER